MVGQKGSPHPFCLGSLHGNLQRTTYIRACQMHRVPLSGKVCQVGHLPTQRCGFSGASNPTTCICPEFNLKALSHQSLHLILTAGSRNRAGFQSNESSRGHISIGHFARTRIGPGYRFSRTIIFVSREKERKWEGTREEGREEGKERRGP